MTGEEFDHHKSKFFKQSIEDHFGALEDYRRAGSTTYKLINVIFMTICAVTCGANDLKAVAMYAERKKTWLMDILELSSIPSYTTFWTIFALLSPEALEQCFVEWVQASLSLKDSQQGDSHVSIDGKAQRNTAKKGEPHSFVHIVSAWATAHNLTLGQLKVNGKSNEIKAIPQLLDMVDVKGTTVTIDAMGCQTAIASKIIDKGAEYVLALKGNQSDLLSEVENYFTQAVDVGFDGVPCDAVGSKNKAHGRIEQREVYTTEDIDWLPQKGDWKNLKTIIMVKSERTNAGKPPSIETRYYISSLPADAFRVATMIRSHWAIESAHWILDVAFREDEQNANAGNIAENMSLIRRLSLNYLKQEKTAKCGIEIKRQMAGWDNEYLLKVLNVKSFS